MTLYVIKKIILDLLTSLSILYYKFEIMPRVKKAVEQPCLPYLQQEGGGPYSRRHHLLVRHEIRINACLEDDPEGTVSSHQYCLTILSDLIAFI